MTRAIIERSVSTLALWCFKLLLVCIYQFLRFLMKSKFHENKGIRVLRAELWPKSVEVPGEDSVSLL